LSVSRLEEHRRLWHAKPILRKAYAVWFDQLIAATAGRRRVLEVGAGPGFLADRARAGREYGTWIATDILPTAWNDIAADALRLPVRSASLDAVVGIDFIHHLATPGDFFREAGRVLVPGGILATVEPWITPFSFPIYRFLHQERCSWRLDPWHPFGEMSEGKDTFDGDAAVLWHLVRGTEPARWAALGLTPPRVRTMNSFAYLFTLGFRPASLLPAPLAPALFGIDRALGALSGLFAMRAFLIWERLP
jgi:SAM-dependent methyltransferase